MTRDDIEDILRPMVDINAPYPKRAIDAIMKLHDNRVTELLNANNGEVQHRRELQRQMRLNRDRYLPMIEGGSFRQIGATPHGYGIFSEENEIGGHRYWSDEIGGGVMIWDDCLVSRESLETVLKITQPVKPATSPDNVIENGSTADLYHAGTKRFYRAMVVRPLTHDEALNHPLDIPNTMEGDGL